MGNSAINLPKIGQRIRFAILYKELWRPLCWLRAGKDGSIYLGTLSGKPEIAKWISKPAAKSASIKYRELENLSKLPKSSRISFHPNGEIHMADKILQGFALIMWRIRLNWRS